MRRTLFLFFRCNDSTLHRVTWRNLCGSADSSDATVQQFNELRGEAQDLQSDEMMARVFQSSDVTIQRFIELRGGTFAGPPILPMQRFIDSTNYRGQAQDVRPHEMRILSVLCRCNDSTFQRITWRSRMQRFIASTHQMAKPKPSIGQYERLAP